MRWRRGSSRRGRRRGGIPLEVLFSFSHFDSGEPGTASASVLAREGEQICFRLSSLSTRGSSALVALRRWIQLACFVLRLLLLAPPCRSMERMLLNSFALERRRFLNPTRVQPLATGGSCSHLQDSSCSSARRWRTSDADPSPSLPHTLGVQGDLLVQAEGLRRVERRKRRKGKFGAEVRATFSQS